MSFLLQKGFLDTIPREAATWSNMPEDPRAVLGGLRNLPDLRNMPDILDSLRNLPGNYGYRREDVRDLPDDLRNFPWSFGQYGPPEAYLPDAMRQDNSLDSLIMQGDSPFDADVRDLPLERLLLEEAQNQMSRNSPRFSAVQEA